MLKQSLSSITISSKVRQIPTNNSVLAVLARDEIDSMRNAKNIALNPAFPNHLGGSGLQRTERQVIAENIGLMQGNRYLGRMLQQGIQKELKSGYPFSASSRRSTNQQLPINLVSKTIQMHFDEGLDTEEACPTCGALGGGKCKCDQSFTYLQRLNQGPPIMEGHVQRAAVPVAAILALLKKCAVSALLGLGLDATFQAALHGWKKRKWRFWESDFWKGFRLDYCSLALSSVLSCIGGVVSAKWLDKFIGKALGGIEGPLLGRLLIFLTKKAGVGIPKFLLKKLSMLGCVTQEQAKEIAL